jgi:hypothetical protein
LNRQVKAILNWGRLLLIPLFFSCREAGIFDPRQETFEVSAPVKGALFLPGETIDFSCYFRLKQGGEALVELRDDRGEAVLSADHRITDAYIPPLDLPEDLPPGAYTLVLSVSVGDERVGETERTIFVAESLPRIKRMLYYPAVFLPGAEGLVDLEADYGRGDPFIRWRLKGQILGEGRVSQGAGRLILQAPAPGGVYTLRAEIFPQAPPPGQTWDFPAPVFLEKDIISSPEADPGQGGLPYPGEWYTLFHFFGESRDWGNRPDPLNVSIASPGAWDQSQGLFGYRNAAQPLTAEGFLFPVSPEGRLESFSLCLVFSLDDLPLSRTFLETSSGEDFVFTLFSDEEGVPGLRIVTPTLDFYLKGEQPWEGRIYKPIIISVFPDYDRREIFISWYQDGNLITTAKSRWNDGPLTDPGETVIRTGRQGFGILDELGVYYRDTQGRPSPVPRIFASHIQELYRSRVAYADGFDSPHLAEELKAGEVYNTGDTELLPDRLALHPGGLFHFPGLGPEGGTYLGYLTISPDSGGGLYFQLRGIQDGQSILLAELPLSSQENGVNQIQVSVRPYDQELVLNGDVYPFPTPDSAQEPVYWAVNNRGEGILFLKEIAIIKDPVHLESLGNPAETP